MLDFALDYLVLLLSLFMYNPFGENIIMASEDVKLNFTELALKYGQICEEHDVPTKDGYILKLFHIPGDNTRPLLLISGNMGTADEYIVRGNTSIAVALANANYDVWAGNVRGCKYSRRHISLNPDVDKEYWNFSFHEYGVNDMAAFIDYILIKTKQKQVNVIGYSVGTTVFYVLGSEKPEYNEKVRIMISMAPISYLFNSKTMSFINLFAPIYNRFLVWTGQEEINGENAANVKILRSVCSTPFTADICFKLGLYPLAGYDSEEIEPEFAPIAIGHYPSSISRKNMLHLSQLVNSKRFTKFDYGPKENLERYGYHAPPDYNLSAVTMRVALISGKNDLISTQADVELLKNGLPNVIEHVVLNPKKFNHFDFAWGKNTHKVLFPYIFKLLESQYQ